MLDDIVKILSIKDRKLCKSTNVYVLKDVSQIHSKHLYFLVSHTSLGTLSEHASATSLFACALQWGGNLKVQRD
jgi:hypothetical protein